MQMLDISFNVCGRLSQNALSNRLFRAHPLPAYRRVCQRPPKKQSKWESETVVLMKGIRTPLAAVFLRVISWDESPCENFVECGVLFFESQSSKTRLLALNPCMSLTVFQLELKRFS
jgi:hypothetical protein